MGKLFLNITVFLFLVSVSIFAQDQMTPVSGTHDTEKVSIDKYVFETALNSADRTITFLQWVIGVFSGVITILFVIFKYRDEKSLEKNRDELKDSQDKIERIRLELIDEEHKMNSMLEKLQTMTQDYEKKISTIERKIAGLEIKSDELDRKTDNMNEINRYFSIAYSAVENNNNAEAVKYYTRIIEAEPDALTMKVVLNNRGIAYQNLGRSDLAIKDYQRVISMDPNHPQSYGNRGNVYDANGEYEKAVTDYTKAIELKPDYADAYFNRASTYMNLKKYNDAAADFRKLLQIAPDDAAAAASLAEIFLITSKLPDLKKVLDENRNALSKKNYLPLVVFYEAVLNLLGGESDTAKETSILRNAIDKFGKPKWDFTEITTWAATASISPEATSAILAMIDILKKS
ncbi:MAG: tetratricopeptide repeat protein [Ignavibacteria bacterium]|nr:tetratricopeptide repeat protein [Ignavibacteria bacterium]